MKPPRSLLSKLTEDYPAMFANPPFAEERLRGSTMYFSCGDGWYSLLDSLLNYINHNLKRWRDVVEIRERVVERGKEVGDWIPKYFEEHPNDPLETFRIDQVKEKFGGLRFYYEVDPAYRDSIDGAVSLAEMLSYKTCEVCGHPGECGNVKGSGWIQTLCSEHKAAKTLAIAEREAGYAKTQDEAAKRVEQEEKQSS